MTREERKRLSIINKVKKDNKITHCYIYKPGRGYYLYERSGYTDDRRRAWVFTKQAAILECSKCREEIPTPIKNEEHNKLIINEISTLASKLIL